MKQPTFNGTELLPMSTVQTAHAGNPLALKTSCSITTVTSTKFVRESSMMRTVYRL